MSNISFIITHHYVRHISPNWKFYRIVATYKKRMLLEKSRSTANYVSLLKNIDDKKFYLLFLSITLIELSFDGYCYRFSFHNEHRALKGLEEKFNLFWSKIFLLRKNIFMTVKKYNFYLFFMKLIEKLCSHEFYIEKQTNSIKVFWCNASFYTY